jgi:hypothetical protein
MASPTTAQLQFQQEHHHSKRAPTSSQHLTKTTEKQDSNMSWQSLGQRLVHGQELREHGQQGRG